MSDSELNARRRQVIGRLLTRAARVFQDRATERIRERGFPDYRVGDNNVLVHLEMDGNRISELAERSGVTKQGISQLVKDLETRGFVHRAPDPADGRATLIQFTERGTELIRVGVGVVEELDREFAQIVGEEAHEGLRSALKLLLHELDPDGF